MHKVIVERPRLGSRHDHRRKGRTRAFDEDDASPARGSMSRSFGHRTLNEHLAPLRRWLRAQAGRPWDAVYSELSEHLRADDPVQQHVRDHVDDFVDRHVEYVDGEPFRWTWGRLEPVSRFRRGRLWVCPRTGLLRWSGPRAPTPVDVAPVPAVIHRRFGGCWYALSLARLPATVPPTPVFDVALGLHVRHLPYRRALADDARSALYGRYDVYTVSLRPLTRPELRRLGLRNASTRRDVRRRRLS